ncbi:uncharacterized protein LOC106649952 [Trichogramma pretiosum]|uniref:uncharacterized protein LOC106649952 n=1 Tax=Trichogramma pretiosum TaxID=7493 RepID=UPI000C71C010|nr:uncharacterized protein LOC106649952 [Trichogramma pretiosum]
MVAPVVNNITDQKGSNGPAVPFGEGLIDNATRRRSRNDQIYTALSFFLIGGLLIAYYMYLHLEYVTPISHHLPHGTGTLMRLLMHAILPSCLYALVLLGVTRIVIYVCFFVLRLFPMLSVMMDVTVIASLVIITAWRFSSTDVLRGYDGPIIVGSLVAVALVFQLPATKRAVAIAAQTVLASANLPDFRLPVCKDAVYAAYGAWYWTRPRRNIPHTEINEHLRAVRRFNWGTMALPRLVVAIGESLFNTESGNRCRRFRSLMREEPYIIASVQGHDIRTAAEQFEANEDRRNKSMPNLRSLGVERFMITTISWMMMIRILIVSTIYIQITFLLLGTTVLYKMFMFTPVLPILDVCLFMYIYHSRFVRGAMTIIECAKQDIQLNGLAFEHLTPEMKKVFVKENSISNC